MDLGVCVFERAVSLFPEGYSHGVVLDLGKPNSINKNKHREKRKEERENIGSTS